ncbi:transposase, MuDR, MULE transposase domain protein [Tanacetum coccineum]
MDEKAWEEKIRQKQPDDDEYFMEFGVMRMLILTVVCALAPLTIFAIVKSCSPNALGDLNVTLKDLSGTVPGTIHYKVLDVSSYEKDITVGAAMILVGAAMILVNVSVFTPKPSKHYLNITKRNVVEVFRKDTVSLA